MRRRSVTPGCRRGSISHNLIISLLRKPWRNDGGTAVSLLPMEESITNMNLGVCCWMLRRFLSFEFEILCFWCNNQVLGASGPSTLSFLWQTTRGLE